MSLDTVQLPLVSKDHGLPLGALVISVLPKTKGIVGQPLIRVEPNNSEGIEEVQLVEGVEYRFEFRGGRRIRIDKTQIFSPDDEEAFATGRIFTGLSTGRVELSGTSDGIAFRPIAFEVRSTKLDYLSEYRAMLSDIARLGSQLVLERFAVSEQRLEVDTSAPASVLYERFVFLRGLVRSERIEVAIRRILATPYIQWESFEASASAASGVRGSTMLGRRLSRPGPRVETPSLIVRSVPNRIAIERTRETVDNVPNRFVAFALKQWRDVCTSVVRALLRERDASAAQASEPIRRGIQEATELSEYFEDLLRQPLLAGLGTLQDFPSANQVLQKKEGYRDLFQAYSLYEFGSQLAWSGGEDVYGGGQRNVAALYEYWVFIKLAEILGTLTGASMDLRPLVQETSSGLSLLLRRGEARTLQGALERRGRRFQLELWFNRKFEPSIAGGSWTRLMRPDCSLRIVPDPSLSHQIEELWLHFDAKYRIARAEELAIDAAGEPESEARREDLLKMHAYRDAIVRAAGAYVIFPGTSQLLRQQYCETLPSLGAFPLRPSDADRPDGAEAIASFLTSVLDQLAEQGSQYERARFWTRRAFQGTPQASNAPAFSELELPSADTLLLLGFVKGPAHLVWIRSTCLYNLRADGRRGSVSLESRELGASFALLYGDEVELTLWRIAGYPHVLTDADLESTDYPKPGGKRYLCLSVRELVRPPTITLEQILKTLPSNRRRGEPAVTTWQTFVRKL